MSIHGISIFDLKCVHFIESSGGLRRAARLLYMSIPALSRRVTRIENLLGFTLFERGHRGMRITPYGKRVLIHARRILGEAAHLKALGQSIGETEIIGEIRLGLADVPVHPLLESSLARWRQLNPQIRIEIYDVGNHEIIASIQNRRIDAGVFPNFLVAESLPCISLYSDNFMIMMRADHDLANRQTLLFEQLSSETLLFRSISHREYISHNLDLYLDKISTSVHSTGIDPLLSLVRAGFGMAFAEATYARQNAPGILFRNLENFDFRFDILLGWAEQAEDPALGRFIAFMRNQLQDRK